MIEERLVLPALADDDAEWAEATRRVREEHGEIRAGAASLARAPSVQAARGLGELLSAHVRFEERTLFPLLERRLSARRLPTWAVRSPPQKPGTEAANPLCASRSTSPLRL